MFLVLSATAVGRLQTNRMETDLEVLAVKECLNIADAYDGFQEYRKRKPELKCVLQPP